MATIKKEIIKVGGERVTIKIDKKGGRYRVWLGRKIDDEFTNKRDALRHYNTMKRHLIMGMREDVRSKKRRRRRR